MEPRVRVPPPAETTPDVEFRGLQRSLLDDFYHRVLVCPWWQFVAIVAAAFLSLNAVFAVFFVLDPGGVANARAGSFEDAFYFSVQTLATIGYGGMTPVTRYAHALVTIEALSGMLLTAVITGLTFAKFARPSARIVWSDKLVVAPRDGVPHLMMRMANARKNGILEAQLRLLLLVEQVSKEGHRMRRPVDLALARDKNPLFFLSWTAMHPIDATSPFFGGRDAIERLRAQKAQVYLVLTGTDETFVQTIHARRFYELDDIVFDRNFADILDVDPTGKRILDFGKFHQVVPVAPLAPVRSAPPEDVAGSSP